MELHAALSSAGLTTLRLHHARRSGASRLALSREWDPELDFARYARGFEVDQLACREPIVLGDEQARTLLTRCGASASLGLLEELVDAGRHEMVVMQVNARLGMRAVNHVHSSVLGRNNGHHAIRAGGVRRHEPDEPEASALVDGLNLGRGMSFKNAAAEIPFGGCKMTVQCAPFALGDAERLGFLAFVIDSGHFMTGPDMGFSPELADVLRAGYTRQIVGGLRGPLGPTGAPTARGTFFALCASAQFAWGSEALAGRSVAIQGLGAVGLPLARLCAQEGARLIVADPDPERLARARKQLGELTVVEPGRVLEVEADVVCPCAVGAVLDPASIARLRCRILCGSANNQLAGTSQAREIELAVAVAQRGIVYAPEWVHNIAGVVAGYEEYANGEHARLANIERHVERVCRDGVAHLLEESRASGRTPTDHAYARVERVIYPE